MTSAKLRTKRDAIDRVQAYRLAMEALADVKRDLRAGEIENQLIRAVASIAANIAEGYSRGTAADRRRFFEYALGSVRESAVWYATLPQPSPPDRLDRLESIRRLLLAMIRNARLRAPDDGAPFSK